VLGEGPALRSLPRFRDVELQIKFRAVLATERLKGSVGHGRVYGGSSCSEIVRGGFGDIARSLPLLVQRAAITQQINLFHFF
jgi:hypothetical protein